MESISRKAVESVEMPPCGFKKALHVIVPSYVTMKYLILIGPLWHSTVFVFFFFFFFFLQCTIQSLLFQHDVKATGSLSSRSVQTVWLFENIAPIV